MSGGSYQYIYIRVLEAADDIERCSMSVPRSPNIDLRLAFVAHLRLVAEALHDIEWVDSCDYGPEQEIESIKAVIGKDMDNPKATAIAMAAKLFAQKVDAIVKGDEAGKGESDGR